MPKTSPVGAAHTTRGRGPHALTRSSCFSVRPSLLQEAGTGADRDEELTKIRKVLEEQERLITGYLEHPCTGHH